MTRRHHFHDFPSAPGDPVYRVSFDCHSAAERDAVRAAGLAVVVPAAFIPALSSGPAFDSPELPVATTPRENVPPDHCVVHDGERLVWRPLPPNCDGFAHSGQEPTQAGQLLAHAQHEAAEGGPECTATACLMARGAND
jgi:hypothetical protein